jgi:dihydropyrimidinase
MHDLVILGGRVVGEGGIARLDLGVSGERIAEIAPRIDSPARRRIDATDLLVLPGGIDPHVHFGLPTKGTRSSDDPRTGTAAALFGGVTTVIDFTIQRPGQRLVEGLEERLADFEGNASCDYALHVNVTDFPARFEDGLREELEQLAGLGAASLKVFTAYSKEGMSIPGGALRVVMRMAREQGFRLLVHAEDDRLVAAAEERLRAAGRWGAADFPFSRPAEAEARAIEAVCEAAREAEAEVYFVHVSTAGGLDAIRKARERGASAIRLETCPQYLCLDDSRYAGPDGMQYLVAPPLRNLKDRQALLGALWMGDVDVVATDHCSFRKDQKDRSGAPFWDLPKGLPGVETRLPLLLELAARGGEIDRVVALTSTTPARIFGLYPRKGCLAVGSDADVVLLDPEATRTVSAGSLRMATDFSPYEGMKVRGRIRKVLLRGTVVVDGGALVEAVIGRYLRRRPSPAADL